MSEKVMRLVRKEAREANKAVAPDLQVCIQNELITRQRVDALEEWARRFSRMSRLERLRWLLR